MSMDDMTDRVREFGLTLSSIVRRYPASPSLLAACPLLARSRRIGTTRRDTAQAYSVVSLAPIRVDQHGACDTTLLDAKLPTLVRAVITEIDIAMTDLGRCMLRAFAGETAELPFARHFDGAVFEHEGDVPHLVMDDGLCVLRVDGFGELPVFEWRYRVRGDFKRPA